MSSSAPLLKINGLTKRFTGIVAVDHVNLTVEEKEIHAIIGENGAGKSTLCKMITGAYPVDEGSIQIDGQEMQFSGPADSMAAGIQMVYQERNLISYLTGAQNISLNAEKTHAFVIDQKAAMKLAESIRTQLNVDVALDVPISELGAGGQQLIEIMRAFATSPKLLILDEPTASLGESEIVPFLKFVKRLSKEMDVSVIYITHKLEEIFQIADKVTVMNEGKITMTANIAEVTQDDCVKAMIKSDKIKSFVVPVKNFEELAKHKVLEVQTVNYHGAEHQTPFYVSFGEVVGFYGLVGSGRTETAETIAGVRPSGKKKFLFDGEEIVSGDSFEMIRKGMVITPELRKNGIFPALNLVENVCTLYINKFATKLGFVRSKEGTSFAKRIIEDNGTKYASLNQVISSLSGGNIQKIIVGRSIGVDNLKLLIVDEPTAGLDLGAKSEIYVKLRRLADEQNKGVIFISSELEELLKTCDRIYVFYNGNITKEFKRGEYDKEKILYYTLGGVGK